MLMLLKSGVVCCFANVLLNPLHEALKTKDMDNVKAMTHSLQRELRMSITNMKSGVRLSHLLCDRLLPSSESHFKY